MIPNIKLLGVFFAIVGAFASGWYLRGNKADADIFELKYDWSVKAIQQQEKVISYEKKLQAIANQAERNAREQQRKRDAELATYQQLVSAGGLWDNYSTHSSTVAGSTGSNNGGTGGTRLSTELSEFLVTEASKADRNTDQLKACQEYIKQVTEANK